MGDEEARRTFPDPAQRAGFCSNQWSRRLRNSLPYTALAGTSAPAWQKLVEQPAEFAVLLNRWAAETDRHSDFKFRAKAGDKRSRVGEISIYGPIGADFFGDGLTAKRFERDLRALGTVDLLEVHIDSPGGQVTDARTIYTLLTQHGAPVNVRIDGVAASAASFIAMAGDNIAIAEGGFMMIHEARGVAFGTAEQIEKGAQVVRAVNESITDTYVARTGSPRKKIADMMAEETWMSGADAVKAGFASEILPNKTRPVSARVTAYAEAFGNLPSALLPKRQRAREMISSRSL